MEVNRRADLIWARGGNSNTFQNVAFGLGTEYTDEVLYLSGHFHFQDIDLYFMSPIPESNYRLILVVQHYYDKRTTPTLFWKTWHGMI